jgi:hypothetical protein
MIRFERSDIQSRPARTAVLLILGMFLTVIAACFYLFNAQTEQVNRRQEAYQLPSQDLGPRPGQWKAETLKLYRESQLRALQAYSWTDASHSSATVPINRAIDIAIEHNLFDGKRGHHAR